MFAAALPDYVEISFTDENVQPLDFDEDCDLVAISMMLSTQVKRGWSVADWKDGHLQKVYNFMPNQPPVESIGPAKRDLYKKELYNHKGVQMVDLFHLRRGIF